jgi:hypothetical protein
VCVFILFYLFFVGEEQALTSAQKREAARRRRSCGRRVSFAPPAKLDMVREYEKNALEWTVEPLKIQSSRRSLTRSQTSAADQENLPPPPAADVVVEVMTAVTAAVQCEDMTRAVTMDMTESVGAILNDLTTEHTPAVSAQGRICCCRQLTYQALL